MSIDQARQATRGNTATCGRRIRKDEVSPAGQVSQQHVLQSDEYTTEAVVLAANIFDVAIKNKL
jgi:hypothetical protein